MKAAETELEGSSISKDCCDNDPCGSSFVVHGTLLLSPENHPAPSALPNPTSSSGIRCFKELVAIYPSQLRV